MVLEEFLNTVLLYQVIRFSCTLTILCPVTGILVLKVLVPGPIFSLKILVPRTNFF